MAHLPPSSFVIRTDNFLVRPLTRDDANPALESWSEDEGAMEMLNATLQRWSIAEQVAYFSRYAGSRSRYLLGLFPNGRDVAIGMFIVKVRLADSVMLLTHVLGDKEWRGTGASREASIGIFDYFFNTLGFEKAKANVRSDNKAMQWLLLNGGWRQEAYLLKHLRLKSSGDRSDLLLYGILADEWRAKRGSSVTVPRRKREKSGSVGRP
ncbi:MAG: GNAT family N-acetyltransferase [Parvibaculaceae bacterium]